MGGWVNRVLVVRVEKVLAGVLVVSWGRLPARWRLGKGRQGLSDRPLLATAEV